jgi:GT2 family glycosyltransferase
MFGSTQLMAGAPSILDGAGDNYSVFGIAWRGGYGSPATHVDTDIEVFSLCAAAALYRRDVFFGAGGFAEAFFCYLEDIDLCFRLRLQGQRAMLVADARVLHVGSAIAGTGTFAHYHTARNGVWLLARCMPWQLLFLVFPLHLASQIWLIFRGYHWRARIDGLKEGLRTLPTQWPARHELCSARRLPILRLCRMLVWNPRSLSQRRIVPLAD